MHYQLVQSAALLVAVVPAALGAVTAPSLERRAVWETTTEHIDISELADFNLQSQNPSQNPNPGAVVMRDLEKRSSFTVPVCRFREPGPRSGGQWLFMDGYCDRTGTDVNTFKLTCQASTQHSDIIYRVPGQCKQGQWCVEYHGYSELGQAGHDIVCVDTGQIHTWALNSFHNPGKSACSAGWNNRGKTNLKATLEVDVMDAAGLNRIAPQEVYYLLNQKRIGVSRGHDSEVGSGSVIIPPGGSLQACVTPIAGQILNMLGALTSLVRV